MNAAARFAPQALPAWRRAVLKVGSSLLAPGGVLSDRNARALAQFVGASRAAGRDVVLVSSGAVAAGRAHLSTNVQEAARGLVLRQALAALGQTHMMALWQGLLDAPAAQVLLSHDDLRNRRRYLNARNTLLELLRLGAVPIVNENDTVAVEELKLGDNDNLAAIVAALADADVLLIASDVAGLYDAHPGRNPDAQPVPYVGTITPEVLALAGEPGSALGTGGMRTKLEAAQKAASSGIETLLFDGADRGVLEALGRGEFSGTRIAAAGSRLAARKYWLRHAPGSSSTLQIDAGAARALAGGASLLPGGIVAVSGECARGDIVEIALDDQRVARGLCQYSANEVRRLAGRHTRDIETVLGFSYGDSVVRRDDLVLLADTVTA
jgi:glutamate 5-kinase